MLHIAANKGTTTFNVEFPDGSAQVVRNNCVGSLDYTFTNDVSNMGTDMILVTNLNDNENDTFTAVWSYKDGNGPSCSVSQRCYKQCKDKPAQSSSASSVVVAFGALAVALVLAF